MKNIRGVTTLRDGCEKFSTFKKQGQVLHRGHSIMHSVVCVQTIPKKKVYLLLVYFLPQATILSKKQSIITNIDDRISQ